MGVSTSSFVATASLRDASIFGMNDLQSARAASDFSEASQPRAASHLLVLRVAEVEEAEGEPAGAIADSTQKLSPPAEGDLGELHFAFNDGAIAVTQ